MKRKIEFQHRPVEVDNSVLSKLALDPVKKIQYRTVHWLKTINTLCFNLMNFIQKHKLSLKDFYF